MERDVLRENFILDADGYKPSHYLQFPPGTDYLAAYLEPRGGKYPLTGLFGLQYHLKRYYQGRVITQEDIDEAKRFVPAYGAPFNEEGWRHIAYEYEGRLPLKIRAVPEGLIIPTHNPMVTVENTGGSKTFWLTGYIETMLSRVWYPTAVYTRCWHMKQQGMSFLKLTSENPEAHIGFHLLDFGSRGTTCPEQAMLGGMAYLAAGFIGSDTMRAVRGANHYYGVQGGMSGYTIPASEHTPTIAWGKKYEMLMFKQMIDKFAVPGGYVAMVMDSYDQDNALENIIGDHLRELVIEKAKAGANIVLRLDSGDPRETVPRALRIIENKFGTYRNKKDYKVLNHKLTILQGDGIDEKSHVEIMERIVDAKFSIENIKFGSGGGILQKLDRDTQKVAYKGSMVQRIDGPQALCYPICKDPKTDPGKKSKEGYHYLVKDENGYKTVSTMNHPKHVANVPGNVLETVFENGEIKRTQTLDEVRALANGA